MKANEQKAVGHTAGPWHTNQVGNHPFVSDENGERIADCGPSDDNWNGWSSEERAAAHARLIACAPEMLAALDEITNEAADNLESIGLPHDKAMMMLALVDNARAIIARAKGEA